MAKPSNFPDWATGGSADIVEPTAGKKALGFLPEEKPPAQHHNWLFNTIYTWFLWLDELISTDDGTDVVFGARDSFDFGDFLLRQGSVVAGGTTMLAIDATDLDAGETVVRITGTSNTTEISEDGVLSVDSISTGDVDALSLKTAEADTKHDDRMVFIGAAGGMPGTPGGSGLSVAAGDVSSYWTDTDSGHTIYFTLPVPKGSRLKAVKAYVRDSGSTVSLKVYKVDGTDGSQSQLGSTQTTAGSSSDQQLAVTSLTDTAGDDHFYNVHVVMAAANQRVYGVRYTFDRVA